MAKAFIQNVVNFILQRIRSLIWLVFISVYFLQSKFREDFSWNVKQIFRKFTQCFPAYSPFGELATLHKISCELKENAKVPRHLAISIIDGGESLSVFRMFFANIFNLVKSGKWTLSTLDKSNLNVKEKDDDELDVQSLARLISWAWIADITVISLYDYNGKLKSSYNRDLTRYLHEELESNLWVVKRTDKPPKLKFHNLKDPAGYKNGHLNGVNGSKPSETLHICLYSNEDGKGGIVRAANELINQSKLSSSSEGVPLDEISEKEVDSKYCKVISLKGLPLEAKTDPDLLIILGNVKSTLGFLPWQIRLTEIHWLPPLHRIEIPDFLKTLRIYGGCHQRFGT